MSAPISASGRRRGSPQQRRKVFVSVDHPNRCLITFTTAISGGNKGRSPEQRQRRNVGCPWRPSATGRRFTKNPGYCKWSDLQKGVLFCKWTHISLMLKLYTPFVLFATPEPSKTPAPPENRSLKSAYKKVHFSIRRTERWKKRN